MAKFSPFTDIHELEFRILSDDDIEKLSVLKVVSQEAINKLGHYNKGGIYDLRLGPMPMSQEERCQTCFLFAKHCMGHCGHIDMPVPVFHPALRNLCIKLLKCICINCGALYSKPMKEILFQYKIKLLDYGFCHETLVLDEMSRNEHNTKVDLDGEDAQSYETSLHRLQLIQITMERYTNDLISGGNAERKPSTQTVASVRSAVVKNFIASLKPPHKCDHCSFPSLKITYLKNQVILSVFSTKIKDLLAMNQIDIGFNEDLQLDLSRPCVLTPIQARGALRRCWQNCKNTLLALFPMLQHVSYEHPTDAFFCSKLLVIPPKFRPLAKFKDIILQHESSIHLANVLKLCHCLTFMSSLLKDPSLDLGPEVRLLVGEIPGATYPQKTEKMWQLLQASVDCLFDSDASGEVTSKSRGIKQILEKKEGLLRSNLMGKRVNFSARSVIAPDPAIAVDEVGVPEDFARHLSYPVYVTPRNVALLRKLVVNGLDEYPGAHMVEFEDGRIVHLRCEKSQRMAIAKRLLIPPESGSKQIHPWKIVYRQMVNGDWVYMNRQPTLHRPSIQGHKVRVLPGVRVLTMPYANCKAYNADFDGDEMNLHFLQNELARSEAQNIVTTHNQYLTPKDGSPLGGLVQDCVVSGVLLTVRGQFFNREDYIHMVNVALQDHAAPITTLTPTLIKPEVKWSGKQIVSTILHNIIPYKSALPIVMYKTSIKDYVWQSSPGRTPKGGQQHGNFDANEMSESEFIVRNGELLCGVLDKSSIGSSSYGLIHLCYDLYGGEVASRLMTAFNRLCLNYLKLHGHTISSKEFLTPASVAQKRRRDLNELIDSAPQRVVEKLGMNDVQQFRDFWETNHLRAYDKNLAEIDSAFTQVLGYPTSQITTENELGLFRKSLDNSMRLMVDSGAKGSKVNMNQMASLFGPTAIDGKRMPVSVAGKTLPSFLPYDMNPRAGGYVASRFMTGMDPQSYFFLCIVGRDSLQHTAVKTANSGYMQRCLIKHLEGIQVMYDHTVRNSDGLVLQFQYGEDGLDVMKVPFLRSVNSLDAVVVNYSRLIDDKLRRATEELAKKHKINSVKKKISKQLTKYRTNKKQNRVSGYHLFCAEQKLLSGINEWSTKLNSAKGRTSRALELQYCWCNVLSQKERDQYNQQAQIQQPSQPDPLISRTSGHDKLGVISEALDDLIDNYYSSHYAKRSKYNRQHDRKCVEATVAMKALRAHVDPGEAVGAICAQAIGEPLTQMTLNTFHFAGRDELNVTLGIPRMVEILRTATANISTPIMEVPFHSHITESQAFALKKKFTEVTLAQVLHAVDATVQEVCFDEELQILYELVKLRFTLLPSSHYKYELPVTAPQVLHFIEKYYVTKGILKGIETVNKKIPAVCATMKKIHTTQDVSEEDEAKTIIESDKTEIEPKEEEETSDVEMMSGGEDDDMADKSRRTRQVEQDYDDDSETDNLSDAENEALMRDSGDAEDEGFEEVDEENEGVNAHQSWLKRKKTESKKACVSDDEVQMRRQNVIASHTYIVDYEFDSVNEEWCEVTLRLPKLARKRDIKSVLLQTAHQAYVHRVSGVKRAMIEPREQGFVLRTEGVNIYKLVEWANLLDINRLYTNDIQLIARTFGIEAAQRSIIKEIRAVLDAYNITVDYRHLTLLADYFTSDGVYRACSRSAIDTCQSTLQKISYETSLKFLVEAVTQNAVDRMASPSARLMTGLPLRMGTNVMDILMDTEHCFPHSST